MAFVELQSVQKVYPGGVQAVQDLELGIEEGEFVVLVGPSGCGKSTTLRMVAGLETITGGDLVIDGRRVNDVKPRDRDIAMVFQTYALYPHMTVFENMAFGLKLRRTDKAEIDRRVSGAAKMLGLEDLLKRKPGALSGGQRQRVAMGRAIVREPKVFLFDEPLSNLDAKLRVQMRAEIASLHRRLSTTMLYVTHDQVEAMTLATRIAVLDKGRLMQFGAPLELYNTPANLFVASFIGSPSMNLVEGEFASGNFKAPGLTIALADKVPGGKGTLGIRPEHVTLAETSDAQVVGTVSHVERMGSTTFAHMDTNEATGSVRWVVRLEGDAQIAPGDSLGLTIDPSLVHLFDENGDRLAV